MHAATTMRCRRSSLAGTYRSAPTSVTNVATAVAASTLPVGIARTTVTITIATIAAIASGWSTGAARSMIGRGRNRRRSKPSRAPHSGQVAPEIVTVARRS